MLFTVCLALRVCVLGWVMPSRHRDSLRFVACIRCSYFLDRASPAFEFACAEWTTNAHDDSALLVSTLMQSLSSHIGPLLPRAICAHDHPAEMRVAGSANSDHASVILVRGTRQLNACHACSSRPLSPCSAHVPRAPARTHHLCAGH